MNTGKISAAACRWTARIVGALLVLMVIAIAIGEGMPNPFTQPFDVQLGFFALALIVLGILVGWRWDGRGRSLAGRMVPVLWISHRHKETQCVCISDGAARHSLLDQRTATAAQK